MHNLHTLSIVAMCVGCWLLLDIIALAILIVAREYSQLKHLGRTLLGFGSKAMFALPGLVFAGLLAESIGILALQPLLYAIGAVSSCMLLTLCLQLE
jgi:hypothetical protein